MELLDKTSSLLKLLSRHGLSCSQWAARPEGYYVRKGPFGWAFGRFVRHAANRFVFTDGSYTANPVVCSGSAWLIMDGSSHIAHGKFGGGKATSFDAEMMGLARGVNEALRALPAHIHQLTLCSDNKAALRQIVRPQLGPSQMAAISACAALRAFLSGHPARRLVLLWVPSHKRIDPNEFVDALAKEALDADQPDFVSYSLALARVKARMKSKWDCVARDANAVHYRGRHLWVSDDPLLHGSTAATTWLLKHAGKSNADVARTARILTNHFPCGEYRARFNIPGPQDCPCGGGLETRHHILFQCPFWIRTKAPVASPLALPHDDRTRQLHAQCGWSAGDVLEFLRLNPMVSTFGWAEILAEALADRAAGRPHSRANARLQAHTTERVFRWRRFYQVRGKVPELACARSDDFDAFTAWCAVETRADNLLVLWEERDARDASCSPFSSRASSSPAPPPEPAGGW